MKKKLSKKNFFENIVILSKTKLIKNSKGNLTKFINLKSNYFKGFGEIYFTEVKKNQIKGWKKHIKNYSLIRVVLGKVKFTFCYKDHIYSVIVSQTHNLNLQIPPKIWFAFQGLSNKNLICNFMNNIHSDKEVENKKYNEFKIKK